MRSGADRTRRGDDRHANIARDKRLGDLRAADVDELRFDAFLFEQLVLLDQTDERVSAAARNVADGKVDLGDGGLEGLKNAKTQKSERWDDAICCFQVFDSERIRVFRFYTELSLNW